MGVNLKVGFQISQLCVDVRHGVLINRRVSEPDRSLQRLLALFECQDQTVALQTEL